VHELAQRQTGGGLAIELFLSDASREFYAG